VSIYLTRKFRAAHTTRLVGLKKVFINNLQGGAQ
jgi:hypothetical protein